MTIENSHDYRPVFILSDVFLPVAVIIAKAP